MTLQVHEMFVMELVERLLLLPDAENYESQINTYDMYDMLCCMIRYAADALNSISNNEQAVKSEISAFAGFDLKTTNTDNTDATFSTCDAASHVQVNDDLSTTEASHLGGVEPDGGPYSHTRTVVAACPTCNKTRCTCDSDYDADDEFSDFNDSSEPEGEEDCDGYYLTTNLRVRHSGPWQQYEGKNFAVSGYNDESADKRELLEMYLAKAPSMSDAQPCPHPLHASSQPAPTYTVHRLPVAPSYTPTPGTKPCPEHTLQRHPPATGSARAFIDFIQVHGLDFDCEIGV